MATPQALQGLTDDNGNIDELQQQIANALQRGNFLGAGAEAAAAPPEPAEVVVPEPDASRLARLQDMGFSALAARRALLMSGGQVNAAVSYLVAHVADADIEAEPTLAELQYALPCCAPV